MKKLLMLLLVLCCMHIAFAQDYAKLTQYLQAHAIHFDPSINNDSFILAKMKGKTLLMYGEGGSHSLKANYVIEAKLANALSRTGLLRNYFTEGPRALALIWNAYVQTGYDFDYIYPNAHVLYGILHNFKNNKEQAPPQFIGIDFERWKSFFPATNYVLASSKPLKHPFLLKITDSASLLEYQISYKTNSFKTEKAFLKFYKKLSKELEQDSLAIKAEINNDSIYRVVQYLVSNPNVAHRFGNRNPPMVKNLLAESQTSYTNYVDFLPIGGMHIEAFISKKFLNAKDSKLKDKVLTMMMYCKECIIVDKTLRLAPKKFFFKNDATYHCFDQVASQMGQYVLFDLTALPPEFQYLRKLNGDLLLFATNVD